MLRISLRAGLMMQAVLVSAALLGALGSEWWGGLVPCALCLVGRWPYRVAIGFALLGLVVPRRFVMACAAGVVLAMLGSAAIGVVHVGVSAAGVCGAVHAGGGDCRFAGAAGQAVR